MIYDIIAIIIVGLLGLLFTYLGVKEDKIKGKVLLFLIAGVFYIFAAAIVLDNIILYMIPMVCFFGIVPLCLGVSFAKDPFVYCRKGEGVYLRSVFHHSTKKGGSEYQLEFKVNTWDKIMTGSSKDTYHLKYIEKHLQQNKKYQIWLDRKNSNKVKFHRFEGFVMGLVLIFLGSMVILGVFSYID